jgi:hypothetical protein
MLGSAQLEIPVLVLYTKSHICKATEVMLSVSNLVYGTPVPKMETARRVVGTAGGPPPRLPFLSDRACQGRVAR